MAVFWEGSESRGITTRVVVECELRLETPAHLGNGDGDDLTDMPLLIDPADGESPLLTGATIAGALRSALRERQHGYGRSAPTTSDCTLLFGVERAVDGGEQSPLIVDDARGHLPAQTQRPERRYGVALDPASRTAADDKLYDLDLWPAGTTFGLRFELVIRATDNPTQLTQALATALHLLHDGSITLGARKRRGFGRITTRTWRHQTFDLTDPAGLLAWLRHGGDRLTGNAVADPTAALGTRASTNDARDRLEVRADFWLDGSLLIRSGEGAGDPGVDMTHLHAGQAGGGAAPVLSGTSLAGALKARARRIAATLAPGRPAAVTRGLESLFGCIDQAARLSVEEQAITGPTASLRSDLVQHRVSIDRFTGGAFESALFTEQPAFGGPGSRVQVNLNVANPGDHEVGLVLLLLKDLWTGDLPLGGEVSVGRGRLCGTSATVVRRRPGVAAQTWTVTAARPGRDAPVTITGTTTAVDDLARFVTAFVDWIDKEQNNAA